MERLRGFPRRFRFPWRSRAQIRRDVEDELAFHLAAKAEALERQGMTPDEAREEALRQFGDFEVARKQLIAEDRRRERRSLLLMTLDDVARDVRFAWRSLLHTPGFTVIAVLVLALGIGVVSGASGVVNVVALKPVMMAEPDEVHGIYAMRVERQGSRAFSYPEYVQLRERADAFSAIAAFDVADAGVETGGITRRAQVTFASANYFEAFGVPLARGRAFTLAEERGEDPAVAVVSHALWVRSGADPDFLGSTIRVNGVPAVVVGIAPRGFTGTTALISTDVFLPLASMERIRAVAGDAAQRLSDPEYRTLLLLGRRADAVSIADAQAELAGLASLLDTNLPDSDGARYTYRLGKLNRFSIGTAPNPDEAFGAELLLPAAMSVVVLAIACLNLANMFLARGASRRTEMAIRQSLGSGRARLVRQLLTEGLLLAILGGLAGLAWSYWATSWIAASAAEAVPLGLTLVADMQPDLNVLLVTAAACVIATLLFGLGPAWRVTGADVLAGLKEGAGAVRFGRRTAGKLPSTGNVLMVGQIALSLAMLTAGGLFVRSALFAAESTPTFSLDRTLVVEIDASLVGADEPRARALYLQVLERLRALPEVEAAGMTTLVPLAGISNITRVEPVGAASGRGPQPTSFATLTDGYFDALRLPLLRGRDFTDAEAVDGAGPRVAIIDEPLARRLFPDSDPLGRRIRIGSPEPGEEPIVAEIVGIAPGTPGDDFDPTPTSHLYLPLGQAYAPSMSVTIGVSERVADVGRVFETIRREIGAAAPTLPVLSIETMREVRDGNWLMWLTRFGAELFTTLGVLALFVAMVGLYGVRAFLLSRRTREIGLHIALGATRAAVLRQMMRESMGLTLVGLAVGLVLAAAVGQVLGSFLYQVSGTDPWAVAGATAFLAGAAAVASWLPVKKALRVEPSAALRHE